MALLFADDIFLKHRTGEHPESPARLEHLDAHLRQQGLPARFAPGGLRAATVAELARVHRPAYIAQVERFAKAGGGQLEADTVLSERSYEVACQAAGAAISAVENVLDGPQRRAVCLIRPPGHHALPERAMGFCLFNNVAVAARHAERARGLGRILIVDWDVHHGNGTQDMFYEVENIVFFSAHRSPFYPGTGAVDETGAGRGLGSTFNLPLKFGIRRKEYLAQFGRVLEDAAQRARPELVLLSAGFDAHRSDPIGSLGLESEDFGALTRLLVQVANQHCQGRLVSLLEGGYNIRALAESVQAHLEAILAAEAAGAK